MLFRKTPTPQSPAPWLKWAVAGFLLMAIVGTLRHGTPESPNKLQEAFKQAATDLSPGKLLPLADYKHQLFPGSDVALEIKELAPGVGIPAACGQTVSIAYESFSNDKKLDDAASPEKPLTFRIGERKILPALEQGATGMRKGGKRSVVAPPAMAYSGIHARQDVPPTAMVRFEIELLDATPTLPDPAVTPYRIAQVLPGSGTAIVCGGEVKAHVTLWDMQGKKLFSTREGGHSPLLFTPGKSEVFLGLEQGVLGMETGGTRTLIVPPAFQKTMNGNKPAFDFPFPKEQTVLVDVEAVP